MYLHPWEVLEIPGNIRLGDGKEISLTFLKKQFAYYKIPMLGQLEYLVDKLGFTNFEGAKSYIDQTLNIDEGPE